MLVPTEEKTKGSFSSLPTKEQLKAGTLEVKKVVFLRNESSKNPEQLTGNFCPFGIVNCKCGMPFMSLTTVSFGLFMNNSDLKKLNKVKVPEADSQHSKPK